MSSNESQGVVIRLPWWVVIALVCGFATGIISNRYAIDWPSLFIGAAIGVAMGAALAVDCIRAKEAA